MACPVIVTERLFLREWRDTDVEAFIVMNADPVVMQFDEKVFRPEDVPIFSGILFRLLDVICLNRSVNFACETAAQSNQTGRARSE